MFRKAQMKLFAVITSILLAIFIIVLTSINIVTKTFMQRQSREVLQQIASAVEYDEKTDTFTFTPPNDFTPKHSEPPPPEKNNNIIVTSATETITETTTETTIIQETTEEEITVPIETESPEIPETEEQLIEVEPETEEQTEPETEQQPPEPTQPPETPTEEFPTENIPPTDENFPPDNWEDFDRPPDFPDDNQHPDDFPFGDKNNWWKYHYHDNEEDFQPQSYCNDDYSILQLGNTVTTTSVKENKNIADYKKEEPVPKSFGSIDFFVIMADGNGNYLACMNNDDLTSEDAQQYITKILDSKHGTGMMNSYQYYNMKKDNGTLIALTDKSEEKKVLKQFIRTTIMIGSLTLVLLSFAGYYLSKKSIEPIKSAFEKQKQFISDASHELKTPLTVISANADVLSGEIGENKWLNYIKSQTDRMNLLVNDLLSLTRLENNNANFIFTDFNLSLAITNTALPFECRAFETNKKFIVDVEDGLTINGSEQHIKQMTAIFIDNALKYSNDGGIVRVSLKKQNDKKVLSIYNTGSGIKDSEKDKIFERFYRTDDSRTRISVGGYGLGLAIAKSIIDKHKFKISIENFEGESINFIITM